MNERRRNRLAVRTCPQCAAETLISNGAFWACSTCRHAITSTALAKERALQEAAMRSIENSPGAEADLFEDEPAYSRR